jgi:hypothetical protein
MHRPETKIENEKMLYNQPSQQTGPWKPMHRINWRMLWNLFFIVKTLNTKKKGLGNAHPALLWNHFLPTGSSICGVKTEHSGLEPYRNP